MVKGRLRICFPRQRLKLSTECSSRHATWQQITNRGSPTFRSVAASPYPHLCTRLSLGTTPNKGSTAPLSALGYRICDNCEISAESRKASSVWLLQTGKIRRLQSGEAVVPQLFCSGKMGGDMRCKIPGTSSSSQHHVQGNCQHQFSMKSCFGRPRACSHA
jgi:hypothetical protein